MKIHNSKEHFDCYSFDNSEKPMVEVKRFRKMASGETSFSNNEIVFVMEGRLQLTLRNNPSGELFKGQGAFLPTGDKLSYKALTNTHVLIFRLEEEIQLCNSFSLERLYNMIIEVEKPEILVTLEMNVRLQEFLRGVADALADGLKCRIYFKTTITDLLIMLRVYYPPLELCRFFYPILSPNTFFSEQVRINFRKCHTVNDLASVMNMTTQQLTRRFNTVFGQPPYEWMQQEKARSIYADICKNNNPFKDIAKQYGFTAQANFNRFCQTAFGMSPGEIRKKRLIE